LQNPAQEELEREEEVGRGGPSYLKLRLKEPLRWPVRRGTMICWTIKSLVRHLKVWWGRNVEGTNHRCGDMLTGGDRLEEILKGSRSG